MSQIPIEEDSNGRSDEGSTGESPERPPEEPIREAADEAPVEERLRRLESIVQKLESEAVSLDESIALFEEGVELAVGIRRRLEASEGRIKRIIEKSEGLFSLEDFDLE